MRQGIASSISKHHGLTLRDFTAWDLPNLHSRCKQPAVSIVGSTGAAVGHHSGHHQCVIDDDRLDKGGLANHVGRFFIERRRRSSRHFAKMNADPLIEHEAQPTQTVAEMVCADEPQAGVSSDHAPGAHPS